jgi:hypothetical protein
VRSLWGRVAWGLVGPRWRVASRGLTGVLLLTVVVLVGGAIAKDPAALDAQEYSAYSDPEKPVLSVILSERQNVEKFRVYFGLSDEEVKDVLAAVRKENEALAQEYGQSERIVASSRGLPKEQIASKIAASDYDEEIRAAVAATKRDVTSLLPGARRADLRSWVDEQWGQQVQAASTQSAQELGPSSTGSRALRCKVFATQYIGYTRYEAALPHRKLKFGSQPSVTIRRTSGGPDVRPRIKEVGPWNTYDNYWATGRHRTMWKDLPRCTPEAQAAYYNNYNNGKDENGRKVLNPAGVDLTPAVARGLGLSKGQNAWVYVRFPWVSR